MDKRLRVIFFGSRYVRDIVWYLNDSFELALVVTSDPELISYCRLEKIQFASVFHIDKTKIEELKKLSPDIGIVANFGLILPIDLIEIFPLGILNVHPSLLPKYRGPTPLQSTILNKDSKSGISIIKLDELMDHGPIIYQEEQELKDTDTTPELLPQLFKRSGEILPNLIKEYASGKIKPKEQNHKQATYTKLFKKIDGYIDMKKVPDKNSLNAMIRALSPWPGVWTKYKLNGKEMIIKIEADGVQVEGKKSMLFKDFINGYKEGKEFLSKLGLN